jgi:hypothetical protein
MRALVASKLLLIVASLAVWSHAATAQNAVRAPVQAEGGLGTTASSPQSKPGRNSQTSTAQFRSVCLTDRGLTCPVSSNVPILPDSLCHCGSLPGATLSPAN